MKTVNADTPSVLPDESTVLKQVREAVRDALLDHKRTGDPIAIWRDGKVVIVPADEIVVPPEDELTPALSDAAL